MPVARQTDPLPAPVADDQPNSKWSTVEEGGERAESNTQSHYRSDPDVSTSLTGQPGQKSGESGDRVEEVEEYRNGVLVRSELVVTTVS